MALQVFCPHCAGRAVVSTSRAATPTVREFWAGCKDLECGHTFAGRIEVIHSIRPSGKPNARVHLPVRAPIRHEPPSVPPAPANDEGLAERVEA